MADETSSGEAGTEYPARVIAFDAAGGRLGSYGPFTSAETVAEKRAALIRDGAFRTRVEPFSDEVADFARTARLSSPGAHATRIDINWSDGLHQAFTFREIGHGAIVGDGVWDLKMVSPNVPVMPPVTGYKHSDMLRVLRTALERTQPGEAGDPPPDPLLAIAAKAWPLLRDPNSSRTEMARIGARLRRAVEHALDLAEDEAAGAGEPAVSEGYDRGAKPATRVPGSRTEVTDLAVAPDEDLPTGGIRHIPPEEGSGLGPVEELGERLREAGERLQQDRPADAGFGHRYPVDPRSQGDPVDPGDSLDAQVWAHKFCVALASAWRRDSDPLDIDAHRTMVGSLTDIEEMAVGWFANAIERGRSAGAAAQGGGQNTADPPPPADVYGDDWPQRTQQALGLPEMPWPTFLMNHTEYVRRDLAESERNRLTVLSDPDESLRKAMVVIGDLTDAPYDAVRNAEVIIQIPRHGGARVVKSRAIEGTELRTYGLSPEWIGVPANANPIFVAATNAANERKNLSITRREGAVDGQAWRVEDDHGNYSLGATIYEACQRWLIVEDDNRETVHDLREPDAEERRGVIEQLRSEGVLAPKEDDWTRRPIEEPQRREWAITFRESGSGREQIVRVVRSEMETTDEAEAKARHSYNLDDRWIVDHIQALPAGRSKPDPVPVRPDPGEKEPPGWFARLWDWLGVR